MMREITVLDPVTIDKIAAGEVVERPASVAKELMENAIDAGATSITVEIREGGIAYLRVSDNGAGIRADQISLAFARHATSKIRRLEDLAQIASLGFRGEALSSISAVSRVECVSRTGEQEAGMRICIEGGQETSLEETAAPVGTTIIVRDLFFNTPARAKFLKTAVTEGNRVAAVVEGLALSHPEIAFRFLQNGQEKIYTSGNGDLRELVFQIFGREVARSLLPVDTEQGGIAVRGLIASPQISRGNRDFENYFVNGRLIQNATIARAIEDAFRGHLMQHRYPFALLYLEMDGESVDVNVHPAKREVRFSSGDQVYRAVHAAVRSALRGRELIPEIREKEEERIPAPAAQPIPSGAPASGSAFPQTWAQPEQGSLLGEQSYEQTAFLTPEARSGHRLIGQIFDTYWILQYGERMYIIDQHAAHEKVLYERLRRKHREKQIISQQVRPSIVISLSRAGAESVHAHLSAFRELGFEIESFGGNDLKIAAVPADLYSLAAETVFRQVLEDLSELGACEPQILVTRLATIACKAAVKGHDRLSAAEADHLLDELLSLEDPYHCPHGRPTIITMSKAELEKKFGRLV